MNKRSHHFKLLLKIIPVLLIVTISFCCRSEAQNTNLSIEQFEQGIAKPGVQVLDVRSLHEYNSGHIKNSLLADWTKSQEFTERIKSLDKNKPVYTYCLSGSRSHAATVWLKENGFKEVYNLQPGILGWRRAKLPFESLAKVDQVTMEEFSRLINGNQPVLVDIGAVWCPPCKKMQPIIKELVETNGTKFRLVEVDGGVQELLVKELNANSFPTFIIYKNGKEVWRKEGLVTKEELLMNL